MYNGPCWYFQRTTTDWELRKKIDVSICFTSFSIGCSDFFLIGHWLVAMSYVNYSSEISTESVSLHQIYWIWLAAEGVTMVSQIECNILNFEFSLRNESTRTQTRTTSEEWERQQASIFWFTTKDVIRTIEVSEILVCSKFALIPQTRSTIQWCLLLALTFLFLLLFDYIMHSLLWAVVSSK